jgi:hypothetical protein
MFVRCSKDRLAVADGAQQLKASYLATSHDAIRRAPRTGSAAPPGGGRGAFLNMRLYIKRKDALSAAASQSRGALPPSERHLELQLQSGVSFLPNDMLSVPLSRARAPPAPPSLSRARSLALAVKCTERVVKVKSAGQSIFCLFPYARCLHTHACTQTP